MNVVIISPLFPDVQIDLSDNDMQPELSFSQIWSKIDVQGDYNIMDLEVGLCEHVNSAPQAFPLSTPIHSLISSYGVFSIDLKANKVIIPYKIEVFPHLKRYGIIRIARSSHQTALDIMKYIYRRHALLLGTVNIDLEKMYFEEYILKVLRNGSKFPHYFILSDHWMKELDPLSINLAVISDIIALRDPERNNYLVIPGRTANSSSNLSDLFGKKFSDYFRLDDVICDKSTSVSEIFSVYSKASKIGFGRRKEDFMLAQLIPINDQFVITAEKMTKTEEWNDYFAMLKNRFQEFSSIQVIWPRNSGKTQLAFNLSHYYKVVYIDFDQRVGLLGHSIISLFEESCESTVYKAIKEMCLYETNGFHLYKELPYQAQFINVKDALIGFFDHLMRHLESFNTFQGTWLQFLNNTRLYRNQPSAMSIGEFKAKYPLETLECYVIYLDNIQEKNNHLVLRYIFRLLGFKVVSAGTRRVKPGIPCYDANIKNWFSISRIPIYYIPNISGNLFNKEYQLQKLCQKVGGDDSIKTRFFNFMTNQINNSFAMGGQIITGSILKSLDFPSNEDGPLRFEVWRDKLFKMILGEFEKEFWMSRWEAYQSLFEPKPRESKWLESSFYLRIDESINSLSNEPFIDVETHSFGSLQIQGKTRTDYCQSPYDFQMVPWANNVFPYLHCFFVLVEKELETGTVKNEANRNYDDIAAHLLINYSHSSLKNKSIRRTPFLQFLKCYIPAFHMSEIDFHYSLNLPTSLNHILESIELPFLTPLGSEWDDILHMVYPNILGKCVSKEPGISYFDYYQDENWKEGILAHVIDKKKATIFRLLSELKTETRDLLIIVTEPNEFSVGVGWKESCKTAIVEMKNELVILRNQRERAENHCNFSTEKTFLHDQIRDALRFDIELQTDKLRKAKSSVRTPINTRDTTAKIIGAIDKLLAIPEEEYVKDEDSDEENNYLPQMWAGVNVFLAKVISGAKCQIYEMNLVPTSSKIVLILANSPKEERQGFFTYRREL